MNESEGSNLEELFNVPSQKGEEVTWEPRVEEMLGKLRRLQEGKRLLEEEIKELRSVKESSQEELGALQTEAYKQDNILQETEGKRAGNKYTHTHSLSSDDQESDRKLQFQCEEFEQECSRQLNQNKKNEELLKQYNCEIQEIKLKHRKQRMKFENQLHQLIEQHKSLHAVFSPERLPEEIQIAENAKCQLLSAEQAKLDQLRCLDEELTKPGIGTAAAEEE